MAIEVAYDLQVEIYEANYMGHGSATLCRTGVRVTRGPFQMHPLSSPAYGSAGDLRPQDAEKWAAKIAEALECEVVDLRGPKK